MPDEDDGASSRSSRRSGGGRDYRGPGITVHWDPGLCIHSANCVREAPGVFDTEARPWVDPSGATADEVASTIDECPSRALTYTRIDGGAEGPGAAGNADAVNGAPVTITARSNGPLVVMGPLEVLDDSGVVLSSGERHFLCRCGESAAKPMCDGSHKRTDFTS